MLKSWFSILFYIIGFHTFAQSIDIPIQSELEFYIEKMSVKYLLDIHSDIKGIYSDLNVDHLDSMKLTGSNQFVFDNINKFRGINRIPLGRCGTGTFIGKRYSCYRANLYLNPYNFFEKTHDKSFLAINPILNIEHTTSLDRLMSTNTRGGEVFGHIKGKLGFYSLIRENQYFFTDYMNRHIAYYNGTIPEQGRARSFKSGGYDLSESIGYITFSPVHSVRLKFGKYKNFVGNGYRSLLLSNNPNTNLNFNARWQFWKFDYQIIVSEFQDYPNYMPSSQWLKKKHSAIHYLSMHLSNTFTLGFFEAVVYDRGDSISNGNIDPNYLNPFILYRSVEYYIGSPDNALLGFNAYWNIRKKHQLYGQFILDEFNIDHLVKSPDGWWANKFAYQLGIKSYNLFGVEDLDFQVEYNLVRPFTYSYRTTFESYSHDSQPIAHPLGANFKEAVFRLKYWMTEKFQTELISTHYLKGYDVGNGENNGGDILKSYYVRNGDFGHYIGQGERNIVAHTSLRISYEILPQLNLDFNLTYRNETLYGSEFFSRIGVRYNMSYRQFAY